MSLSLNNNMNISTFNKVNNNNSKNVVKSTTVYKSINTNNINKNFRKNNPIKNMNLIYEIAVQTIYQVYDKLKIINSIYNSFP